MGKSVRSVAQGAQRKAQQRTRGLPLDPRAHVGVDPDHHLWQNRRTWWIAITLHLPDLQVLRVRRSLGTRNLDEARRRRDAILEQIEQSTDFELSLRYRRDATRDAVEPAPPRQCA